MERQYNPGRCFATHLSGNIGVYALGYKCLMFSNFVRCYFFCFCISLGIFCRSEEKIDSVF